MLKVGFLRGGNMRDLRQLTIINTARQMFGHRWFDGAALATMFDSGFDDAIAELVDKGVFEESGFRLRLTRKS